MQLSVAARGLMVRVPSLAMRSLDLALRRAALMGSASGHVAELKNTTKMLDQFVPFERQYLQAMKLNDQI